MQRTVTIVFLVLFFSSCQSPDSLLNTFNTINADVLSHSEAYLNLKEATETIGHRLTGSDNGRRAEEYAYRKFKQYGFDDVRFEPFEVEAWSREKVTVTIDQVEVPAVSLGHSPIKADVKAELVDSENGLEKDYADMPGRVKGKIALIYLGLLEGSGQGLINLHRKEKTTIAIRHGAVGVLFFNSVGGGILLTGTASSNGELIPIPAVCIGKEKGLELKKRLKIGKVTAHIMMTNHNVRIKARNIIATLPGTELANERILIGGHLDSWDLATGAIDNGIGSFGILDIARTFKASGLKPKRTVQFMLFMGEEQGLVGSRYHVAQEIQRGTINTIGYMMNIDMGGNPVGIQAGGNLLDSSFFPSLGAKINHIDTVYKNQFKRTASLHSDHQPFMLEGIPVLGIISHLDRSVYDCYHANCDRFDLVNEEHLRNTTRFGAMILYGLANADRLPAQRTDSNTTRQFLIDNNLKESLVVDGDWKWEK